MANPRHRSQALGLSHAAASAGQHLPDSRWLADVVSSTLRAVADGIGAGLGTVVATEAAIRGARRGVAEAVAARDEQRERITPVSSPELPTVLVDMSELDDEPSEPTRRITKPPKE